MIKMAVKLILVLFLLVGVLLSAGCTTQGSAPGNNTSTVTVTDITNRTVDVKVDPQRVIGVGAGALRMISYLQATDRVVGVDIREQANSSGLGMPSGVDKPYNLANPELSVKPFVGGMTGDPELIAAQNPDVVFFTFTTGKDAQSLQDRKSVV